MCLKFQKDLGLIEDRTDLLICYFLLFFFHLHDCLFALYSLCYSLLSMLLWFHMYDFSLDILCAMVSFVQLNE